jgi:hypothetical protein
VSDHDIIDIIRCTAVDIPGHMELTITFGLCWIVC